MLVVIPTLVYTVTNMMIYLSLRGERVHDFFGDQPYTIIIHYTSQVKVINDISGYFWT